MGGRQRAWVKLYEMGYKTHFFFNFCIFTISYAASKFVTYVMLLVEILLNLELIAAQLRSYRLIYAHLSSF